MNILKVFAILMILTIELISAIPVADPSPRGGFGGGHGGFGHGGFGHGGFGHGGFGHGGFGRGGFGRGGFGRGGLGGGAFVVPYYRRYPTYYYGGYPRVWGGVGIGIGLGGFYG